jgi:uncharacterized membrane protein YoaK (UPF0700 family)
MGQKRFCRKSARVVLAEGWSGWVKTQRILLFAWLALLVLGGVVALRFLPLAAFFSAALGALLACFAEIRGFSASAPIVTGAFSCSAALGMAEAERLTASSRVAVKMPSVLPMCVFISMIHPWSRDLFEGARVPE